MRQDWLDVEIIPHQSISKDDVFALGRVQFFLRQVVTKS